MQSKQALNDFPKISLNLRNSALSAVKALHVVAYVERICSFLNDFNFEDENDDEDEDASDDDGDKDVYHKENGKDVTEDDGDNEDNDVNSDRRLSRIRR
uniref:Uncharacterized protein LOC114325505 n=1 Tax=Diabrotica virgifera virgifera TaxID=50390 RepID=A0A6P7F3E3_DIAVI